MLIGCWYIIHLLKVKGYYHQTNVRLYIGLKFPTLPLSSGVARASGVPVSKLRPVIIHLYLLLAESPPPPKKKSMIFATQVTYRCELFTQNIGTDHRGPLAINRGSGSNNPLIMAVIAPCHDIYYSKSIVLFKAR